MKITRILVALSFLFTVVNANAGTLSVTGNMETTYHSESGNNTGNPLGMDRELKFAGSTELDNGITVSVMQDTTDSLAYSNSQIAFSNDLGTLYIGSDSDPVDSIDDITPSAYEEANGSGSGTYIDVSGSAGDMGLGIKYDLPILGALNAKYYPKADGVKNADNASSGTGNTATGSAYAITLKTDIGATVAPLAGLVLTTGGASITNSNLANTDDEFHMTAALNYATGPIKVGVQKSWLGQGQTVATTQEVEYNNMMIGIAYAVNDSLSVSYNRITSEQRSAANVYVEQDTDAFNIGYTIGGMTIGFQDAKTGNANYVTGADDDARTLGVSVAF
jgi:hypothetical protein